jgi:hypothetical protein
MATFTHSNLFRVADPATFERMCRDFGVTFRRLTKPDAPEDTFYAMTAEGGWPSYHLDHETGDEFDFNETLAQQLQDDAAVLFEISHEEGGHVSGNAVAIASGFDPVCLDLTDIHLKAREAFGPNINIRGGF